MQLGPWTVGAAQLRPTPANRRRSRPGKGLGRTTRSPRTRWCSAFGHRRHWWRRAAMAGGDGHGGSGCGEIRGGEVQRETVGARGWSKRGLGGFGGRRELGERRAHRRRRQWRSTAGMAWRGGGNGSLNRARVPRWRRGHGADSAVLRRPWPARVRAAPRMDQRSATRTAHVRRHGGVLSRRLRRGVGLGRRVA
jgi:hypothetical protein